MFFSRISVMALLRLARILVLVEVRDGEPAA
jgi:hypothetical protein